MMRKGFSLIMAIFFIVLVSTLGALALSLSTQSAKQTFDVYLREQAELLAQSATEYAILAISAHDREATGNCINDITNIRFPVADTPLFTTDIHIRYLGRDLPAGCNKLGDNNLSTDDSNVTALIDVFVKSNEDISVEPIRYHRRTLQKP